MAETDEPDRHGQPDVSDLDTIVAERLDLVDQRATAARRSLVSILAGTTAPLTLPEILDLDGDLAQSSAYRNLAVLEEAGVVRRVVIGDDHTRYELAEDLTGHHHHLVCADCGAVADFVLDEPAEQVLEAALHAAAADAGFRAEHHRLDLIGTCGRCG
jgi:Fe2+ or Zn2+ uptake regulation protein